MHVRYLTILNHLQGLQNVEIAMNLGICAHTVGTYISKYKKGGLENLKLVPNPGVPRLLTKKQEQQLIEVVTTHTPDEVGFMIKKTGMRFS